MRKTLILIGTSDIHSPIHMDYDLSAGEHRPMTLVFAKEKSEEAIKAALLDRRTAIFYANSLTS
jgi:hypothetical protein